MRINAAVHIGPSVERDFAAQAALDVTEVTLAPPGPGEVLIRIAAAGVCHSDLSLVNGTRPRPGPMVLGHEASGHVEEVGAGVTDLAPGDHVVCIFAPGCRACASCAEGRPALCTVAARHHGVGELLTGCRWTARRSTTTPASRLSPPLRWWPASRWRRSRPISRPRSRRCSPARC